MQAITTACERFIDDVLKPRFLSEIQPTEFNYCVDILGKWHGNRYRFMQRYRNDRPDRYIEPEFVAPFARLEYIGQDRFDLAYFRHTERWWPVDCGGSSSGCKTWIHGDGADGSRKSPSWQW